MLVMCKKIEDAQTQADCHNSAEQWQQLAWKSSAMAATTWGSSLQRLRASAPFCFLAGLGATLMASAHSLPLVPHSCTAAGQA